MVLMETLQLGGEIAIYLSIVVGLTEVAKRLGAPMRFIPLVAIAIGVGLSYAVTIPASVGIIQGIVIGLAAVGLWSGAKNVAASKEE